MLLLLSIPLIAAATARAQTLSVPFYGTSAGGFNGPPRGWNTYGMQALSGDAFTLNQANVQSQCELLNATAGYTLCSIDSGWSGNGGDEFGRLVPDPTVFPNLTELGEILHAQGKLLGVYILPGALSADADVLVEGTNITLGSLFDLTQPGYNLRQTFDWSLDGVQQWHDSVIDNFVSYGVDYIKLDYMTPGSPDAGETLPANNSLAVVAYHKAIQQSGRQIRLDLSWKLDRDVAADWYLWRGHADSLRTDQDINSGGSTFVAYATVQRAIEQYRSFINQQEEDPTRQDIPIMIHPNMDNLYVGNSAALTGLTDEERYTVAIHWIGAGADLLIGSDLTQLDALGEVLLYNPEVLSIADFTAQYPMQPKNPFGTAQPGSQASEQLQTWIAGPDQDNQNCVIVLANYGPDQGEGGFGTSLAGVQSVNISLSLLGIAEGQPNGAAGWYVRRVLGGGGSGGADFTDLGVITTNISATLGEGESALYYLTAAS